MRSLLIINYFGKKFFPIKRKQGVTTVACRLKSEQKEKEMLKLNTTRFKLIKP